MSLDVTMYADKKCPHCGMTIESELEIFSSNITHNLNKMAEAAGIYMELWRPDEIGITKAQQLVIPLKKGLAKLEQDPEYYKKFNAPNGWGKYEHFIPWLKEYLEACKKNPTAVIRVSR